MSIIKSHTLKIALAQVNYHIGNFEANLTLISALLDRGKAEGAELVIFSELAIGGYPARDFLEEPSFISACRTQLEQLAELCTGIACIIGCPVLNPATEGKNLHNAAFLLDKGKIAAQVNKALLPTYDVFDEYRYFEPASAFRCIEFGGHKIALTICEDLWNVKDPLYQLNPMDELIRERPELMINIAASPFHYSQAEKRLEILQANVSKYDLPLVYVNHTGAQTELIFDGGSLALGKTGEVLEQLNYFKEDFRILEIPLEPRGKSSARLYPIPESCNITDGSKQPDGDDQHRTAGMKKLVDNGASPVSDILGDCMELAGSVLVGGGNIDRIYEALVLGIRDYFKKSGFKSAVLGLSGGIDSALVCALAAAALGPENVHGVLMPSEYSSDHSIKDALDLATNMGVITHRVPINSITSAFEGALATDFKNLPFNIAEENLQARTRGTVLMAFSNKFGHILLNTSNKSEAAVGYGTLYGDMCGALSVLGDVYKLQVYQLCHYINRNQILIPINTIQKPPSAELRPDQKDSDSLPEYELLDKILFLHIECKWGIPELVAHGFDAAVVARVIKLVNNAEFKRYQAAPILRISPKAFGMGRRMPIVGKYS